MKTKLLVVLFALFAVNLAAPELSAQDDPTTVELLTNGDFEDGDLSNWTVLKDGGTNGDFLFHTVCADGTKACTRSEGPQPMTVGLFQGFTVPASGVYGVRVSFSAFVVSQIARVDPGYLDNDRLDDDGDTIANHHARVDIIANGADNFGTGSGVVSSLNIGNTHWTTTYHWQKFYFDVTDDLTPGQTYTIRFASTSNQGAINLYVDSVTISADIDECVAETDDCGTNADCFNFYNGYYCACADGFEGDPYSACDDIDECARGHAQCDFNATCTNSAGSFSCDCNTGWSGDGTTCANIDECTDATDDCNDSASCTDTDGGFICECIDGYTGDGVNCAIQCGDFELGGTEDCDDGNNANGDGCAADCTIEDGYECDERYGHPCGALCGDGLVALGAEDCDDGNGADWDGCDFACRIEEGWTCVDDGAGGSACAPICQDALVRGDEECDDGNTTEGDGCTDCLIVQGYICDDAEPTTCVEDTECGNGYVSASEECDDGNTTEADGCSEICTLEANWDCDGGQPTMCEPILTPDPIDPLPSTGVQPGDSIRCSTTDLPRSAGWALLVALGGLFVIRRRTARR